MLIRYKATEKCPKCMELLITSDDPNIPEKILDVMAYTIWDNCDCKRGCDNCQRECYEKSHQDGCYGANSTDCCCDHEDEAEQDDDENT